MMRCRVCGFELECIDDTEMHLRIHRDNGISPLVISRALEVVKIRMEGKEVSQTQKEIAIVNALGKWLEYDEVS